jgi:hypothetical protein
MLLPLHLRTGTKDDPHPDVYLVVMALRAILAILEYCYLFRLNESHASHFIIARRGAIGEKIQHIPDS